MLSRRKRRALEAASKRDALVAWNLRNITSRELVSVLGKTLSAAIRRTIWENEQSSSCLKTIAWLDSLRQSGDTIASLKVLIDATRLLLDPERHNELISLRKRRGQLARETAQRRLLDLENLEAQDAADRDRPQLPRVYRVLREPPEDVKDSIGRELGRLAFFTHLPSSVPPAVLPYARVIALRVFGGWSIERIAEHDQLTAHDVLLLWRDACAWLASEDRVAAETGSLITTPPISNAVLAALQSSPRLLHVLEWRAFERVVAQILESLGYEVELQRGTKDGGIDVVAVRQITPFGPHRYLLQAKRTRNRIGVEPVRELLFLKQDYQATKACLATTSSFTAGALQLANEHRWELELRDFERLREWLDMLRTPL